MLRREELKRAIAYGRQPECLAAHSRYLYRLSWFPPIHITANLHKRENIARSTLLSSASAGRKNSSPNKSSRISYSIMQHRAYFTITLSLSQLFGVKFSPLFGCARRSLGKEDGMT